MIDAINRAGMLAYISKVRDSNMGRSAAIDFIYKYAENAPTVIRQKGEWVHKGYVMRSDREKVKHIWMCDQCGYDGNPDMNYCPSCGSKMK